MIRTKAQANALWFMFVMAVLAASAACLGDEPPKAEKAAEASAEELRDTIKQLKAAVEILEKTIDSQIHEPEVVDDGKYRPAISSTKPRVVTDPDKFAAYQQRLDQRRATALQLRRAYNSGKNHVYWRYNPFALSPFWSAIEQGWVRQPPIPRPGGSRRPIRPMPYVPSHY